MGDFLNSFSLFSFSVGAQIGSAIVFFFLFAIFLAKANRRVVEPNEVHIVQSRRGTKNYGKQMEEGDKGTWPGNSYYEWPHWWPVIGVQRILLPLSVFDQKLTERLAGKRYSGSAGVFRRRNPRRGIGLRGDENTAQYASTRYTGWTPAAGGCPRHQCCIGGEFYGGLLRFER